MPSKAAEKVAKMTPARRPVKTAQSDAGTKAAEAPSRVLILESVEDGITRGRIARKRSFLSEVGITVEYCYAVKLTRKQEAMSVWSMMDEVRHGELNEQDLFERLEQKINSFRPDLMIVHAGFVFSAFPQVFFSLLTKVRSKYPLLKVGSDMGHGMPREWLPRFATVLDHTPEITFLALRIV